MWRKTGFMKDLPQKFLGSLAVFFFLTESVGVLALGELFASRVDNKWVVQIDWARVVGYI